ncbi:hypothetical protein I79_009068 [Cricetulus griseus]|uniref:Uncharacterized protein n=1 Tax=Cricetulus griseus TaxID=10029 RepID=G3HES4_CRIGR|nr:hypothetical protein I79_009068 [Cricetulus griseus]
MDPTSCPLTSTQMPPHIALAIDVNKRAAKLEMLAECGRREALDKLHCTHGMVALSVKHVVRNI